MQYNCEIIDNILYLENDKIKYTCVILKAGYKMRKQVLKKDVVFATIDLKINFLPFKALYNISLAYSDSTYTLEYKGLFKPYYKIKYKNNLYEIYPHRGRKTSIFKNGDQIAFYKNVLINKFNKNSIKIYCNNDANLDVLFLLLSIIEFDFEDDNHTASINFGNILQARKFDKNWTPN